MIRRSIRFKIVLWYMLILSLTFFIFSAALYHMVNKRLQNDINDLLISKAQGIKDSIEAFWEVEKSSVAGPEIDVRGMAKLHNINFEKIVQRWLAEKFNDPLLLNIDLHVFNAERELIASSEKLAITPSLPESISNLSAQNQGHLEDASAKLSSGKFLKLRLLTIPAMENGRVAYFVQVVSLLTSLNSSLKDLRMMLFLLFPFIVALSGLAGTLLARITLSPISRIIDTIHRITAENLKLRVVIPDTKDEVKSLADTFNGMLDRLERAFTSQRQFIEDLSHELKTPLSVLKGELEVTLKKMRSAEDYESILRSSLEEVNTIIKISENLLVLAQYDSMTMALEKSSLNIAELVQQAASDMKMFAQQREILLHLSALDNIFLWGDKIKLRQLFINLIDNALKYTPAQGTVTIEVHRELNWAKISVSDTGVGIPEDELPHVFDRFYRGKKGRRQEGFGLGLSIAKAITEAHQGRIEAESVLNKGTKFAVFLPLSR